MRDSSPHHCVTASPIRGLVALGRPLVELPLLSPALVLLPPALPGLAAGAGLTTLRRSVAAGILLRGPFPVAGGQLDLELVQLVPLGIGALPFRDRPELLQEG